MRNAVPFDHNGQRRALRLDINALCDLEAQWDCAMPDLQARLSRQSLGDLRTIFAAGLRHEDPDLTDKAAGEIMSDLGFAEAAALIGKAMALAFGADPAAVEGAPAAGKPKAAA